MNDHLFNFEPDEDGNIRIYFVHMILFGNKKTQVTITPETTNDEILDELVRLLTDN
jgi:hypothetical protein